MPVSLLRLRDHDRRLHDVHQRVDLHCQLPAHQPPHRVRPAQPLQLLRPEDGVGEGHGQDKLLFYKYVKLKKKKVLSVSLQTFGLLQAVVEIEKIWRCGVGTLSGRVKGEYRCLYYVFFYLCQRCRFPSQILSA